MSIKVTTESFTAKAKEKHNNRYIYDKVQYTKAKEKVIITCKQHGDFAQTPTNHLAGKGCPKCANATIGVKLTKSLQNFVTEAKKKHNNKYDYSKVVYTGNKNQVTIICPVHGEFSQEAKSHLTGHGCKLCADEEKAGAWSYTEWEEAGKRSKHFSDFALYKVKCWNDKEIFYKIGKTFTSISKRLHGMPYEWQLLQEVKGSASFISKLEEELLREHKSLQYTPNVPFKGKTECFTQLINTEVSNG